MSESSGKSTSRRGFLKKAGRVATNSAAAAAIASKAYAQGSSLIQVAAVGCGGRGTGAIRNALSVNNGPIKLVAMGDVFESRVETSYKRIQDILNRQGSSSGGTEAPPFTADQVDVPAERRFVGFNAYKEAMDVLNPGDVVLFATPPAFRWPYFKYAIDKGLNVFMEKPITVDGPSTKRLLKLAELSEAKNLKVGVGLMCRHCDARKALLDRINDGQVGDILSMRAYRMHGPVGWFSSGPVPEGISELRYQVQRFHSFLWASGGAYSDFYIHNIDECCWMKGAWPIKAQGMGGRMNRGDNIDQNFDNYTVEYTFPDDTTLMLYGRCVDGCYSEFASYAHGSKGSAVISTNSHTPARCRIYSGQNMENPEEMTWEFPQPEPNPYQLEWDHLIEAIREDKPYNEAKRGAEASLVTSMGRMAAHTGQEITYDQMLNCEHEFAPEVEGMTDDTPAPLQAGEDGKYPFPEPGVKTTREY